MADRSTSIRRLVLETRTGTDLDTVAEQLVTRALAHESRRRPRPRPRPARAHDTDAHPRRTR